MEQNIKNFTKGPVRQWMGVVRMTSGVQFRGYLLLMILLKNALLPCSKSSVGDIQMV